MALLSAVACADDDTPASPARDGEPITIGGLPTSYRITYQLHEDDELRGIERLTVQRPFESRVESWDGDDDDGTPMTTEIAAFTRTARVTADGQRLAVAIPPSIAPADVRLDVVLDDAIDAGVLVRRGQRDVAGRRCQVYRTGQSLRLVELVEPTDERHVDVCVDGAGLVLEEVDGARRRVAVDVEIEPDVDDRFDVGARTIPVRQGGGVVTELTADSRPPGEFLELGPDLPLERGGRYAVVPPQPEAFTDPLQRGRRVASVADVLREGVDVVIVERGGSLGGDDVLGDAPNATTVDLGDLGSGDLLLTAGGPELTVDLGGGRFVRLSGTIAPDDLIALARGLHPEPGGELVTVGDPW